MNESYYHGDNERIAFVVKQMWGDEESELRHRREASGLVTAYLQWHLERGLRSLPMVERA